MLRSATGLHHSPPVRARFPSRTHRRIPQPATSTATSMAAAAGSQSLVLYGSSGSRSPLVNWYLHELALPFEERQPRDPGNPHPFGQIPALRDTSKCACSMPTVSAPITILWVPSCVDLHWS